MQIVFHVVVKPGFPESLREVIIADLQKKDYGLQVESEKKQGRRGGWAKVKSSDLPGAINIQWIASSSTLIGRAIAKQKNSPAELLGVFLQYLLKKRRRRIQAITIHTR